MNLFRRLFPPKRWGVALKIYGDNKPIILIRSSSYRAAVSSSGRIQDINMGRYVRPLDLVIIDLTTGEEVTPKQYAELAE